MDERISHSCRLRGRESPADSGTPSLVADGRKAAAFIVAMPDAAGRGKERGYSPSSAAEISALLSAADLAESMSSWAANLRQNANLDDNRTLTYAGTATSPSVGARLLRPHRPAMERSGFTLQDCSDQNAHSSSNARALRSSAGRVGSVFGLRAPRSENVNTPSADELLPRKLRRARLDR